jgi:hypothetical protein
VVRRRWQGKEVIGGNSVGLNKQRSEDGTPTRGSRCAADGNDRVGDS